MDRERTSTYDDEVQLEVSLFLRHSGWHLVSSEESQDTGLGTKRVYKVGNTYRGKFILTLERRNVHQESELSPPAIKDNRFSPVSPRRFQPT